MARPADLLPAPWRESPAVGGWRASGAPGDPAFDSATRTTGDSALILPFPATGGRIEVAFTATAPPVAGQRGLNFGVGWFRPERDAYRACLLTFGGGGDVIYWDAGGYQNVAPYRAGQPARIRLTLDPGIGAYEVEVDGQRGPGMIPLYAGIPRVDSLFFSNASTRAEDSPIHVSDIRVSVDPGPPSPVGVVARALSSVSAEVGWRPSPGASRYRIYRRGVRVAEVAAPDHSWSEAELPAGRPVAYSVSAVDAAGHESMSGWPVIAELPADPSPRWMDPSDAWLAPDSEGIDSFNTWTRARGGGLREPAAGRFNVSAAPEPAAGRRPPDLVVVGATPAGIAAALAAARRRMNVLLVSPDGGLGGMMAGGLGRTDFRYKPAQGGLFKEFAARVLQYYLDAYGPGSREVALCGGGYNFEAGVARAVLDRMLAGEPRITLRSGLWPVAAETRGDRLAAVRFEDPGGRRVRIAARAFVDATYEGDLLPLAGVPYRVGRESRAEFGEEHAGTIYWDFGAMTFLPGSTGEGDRRVQAYNYRLPLTNRSGLRFYRIRRPDGYDRAPYASVEADVAAGRILSVARIIDFRPVPGQEFDANNNRYYPSTDFVGESDAYPDADPAGRRRIADAHRRYDEGLLYFLQNDPSLPSWFRFDASQWGWAQDQFRDHDHFPDQLYVREARRMIGEYTFTENDARLGPGEGRPPAKSDSIAVGDYMMDSHATRPQEPDRPMGVLEGFFFIPALTKPYQIPYRILVPARVDGLIVPVAVSSTHVGYGTLRMEPVMMEMGEAAGAAAALAARLRTSLRSIPVARLQADLLDRGAVLTYFDDLPAERPDFAAFQLLGTLGLFPDFHARPDDPIDAATRDAWAAAERAAFGARVSAPPEDASEMTRGEWAIRLFRAARRRIARNR